MMYDRHAARTISIFLSGTAHNLHMRTMKTGYLTIIVLLLGVLHAHGFADRPSASETIKTIRPYADSSKIRLELDTILCTRYLITPNDFYRDLSKCIGTIIGVGTGGNGISDVQTSLLHPSISGSYGFGLNKKANKGDILRAEKAKVFLNVGGGIGFVDKISGIDIRNPNVEFDLNTELSIFFRPRATYNTEECVRYSNTYEDFMVPYIYLNRKINELSGKQDSLKKAGACISCRRDTDITTIDTLIKSSRNYKVLYQKTLAGRPRKTMQPPMNGPYSYTHLDSDKIVTYYYYYKDGTSWATGLDSTISRADSVFKIRYRREYKDSLDLKNLRSKLQKLDPVHNSLLLSAPFNTRIFNWVNLDLSYKIESYLIYNGLTNFAEKNLHRSSSSVYSVGVNYNFYHFVTTRYRHARGNFMAWGGNKYLRVGVNLLFTNAADEDDNGPYKVSIIDTIKGGVPYTKKTVSVFTPGVFDRRINLLPHADFYIMENSRTVGLHLLTNYLYSFENNAANGNKLNAGVGVFISISKKIAQKIGQLKGIPINFEVQMIATDLLHWTAATKFSDRVSPGLKIDLPLNLIGR